MKVDLDYRGIRSLDSREILGEQMLEAAEIAKAEAQRIGPKDTGLYTDTMFARKSRGRFATAVYGASVRYAQYVEYGSHTKTGRWRIRPHHTLRTAAQHVGMKVRG